MASEHRSTNFFYHIPSILESERVALTPFIGHKHAQLFIDQVIRYPEVYDYFTYGPFNSKEEFEQNLGVIDKNMGYMLFAIFDKTRPTELADTPGAFAGLIGLINTVPTNLVTEIGHVMILPPFQRTHVASNAVGILLHFSLDTPRGPDDCSALGLRRAVWQANENNLPSIRLAKRMGFTFEGIMRWARVLPAGKTAATNGIAIRKGDPRPECNGWNTALLAMTWDDWEGGGKQKVDQMMARV